jgi:hypothetical protein
MWQIALISMENQYDSERSAFGNKDARRNCSPKGCKFESTRKDSYAVISLRDSDCILLMSRNIFLILGLGKMQSVRYALTKGSQLNSHLERRRKSCPCRCDRRLQPVRMGHSEDGSCRAGPPPHQYPHHMRELYHVASAGAEVEWSFATRVHLMRYS